MAFEYKVGPPLKPSTAGQERITTGAATTKSTTKSWDLSRNKGGLDIQKQGHIGLINDGWLMIVSIFVGI